MYSKIKTKATLLMEASRASVTNWLNCCKSFDFHVLRILRLLFYTALKMCFFFFSDPGKLLHASTLDKLCHQNCMVFYSSGEVYLIMGACSVCWLWCYYQGSSYPNECTPGAAQHSCVTRFVTRRTIKSVFTTGLTSSVLKVIQMYPFLLLIS